MATDREPLHKSMAPVLDFIKATNANEGEFAKKALEISHGRFTNWKRRGVPQGMQTKVARAIGLSTDAYLAQIGRPTGAAVLQPDEREILDAYRGASPRWRLAIRFLVTVDTEFQDEVSASINNLVAKMSKKPATNKRVEDTYGLPPGVTGKLL